MVKEQLTMKKRISLGFVVLGMVLFFSSLIALFEYSKMSNYVSKLIDDNVRSINLSRDLKGISEDYNARIVSSLGTFEVGQVPDFSANSNFTVKLKAVKSLMHKDSERAACDTLMYAYAAYMQVVNEADTVWQGTPEHHKEWYFGRVRPYYDKLNALIDNLNSICQKALASNSVEMQESFYRSIMPGIVAVAVGIVMVFLFNFFINYYVLNPINRISKGISEFNHTRKDFTMKFQNKDEISGLYDNVKELMDNVSHPSSNKGNG
jgi:HAMP domain-containing protein